ncbi:hypothetical protein BDV24DRAFT_129651 [Aspergillus arachidicola]|uniref:Uncharacterized protein n=1 Tax=Aspergillus arachidicola TaxID=656916 RepID=A0A5N6YHU4_9EURO|nr:hypothetical protein BDV24DRAFT_129651 [Aspergillus arachidicola]
MLEMEGLHDDNSLGPQAGLLFNSLICTGMSAPMLQIRQSKTLQVYRPRRCAQTRGCDPRGEGGFGWSLEQRTPSRRLGIWR